MTLLVLVIANAVVVCALSWHSKRQAQRISDAMRRTTALLDAIEPPAPPEPRYQIVERIKTQTVYEPRLIPFAMPMRPAFDFTVVPPMTDEEIARFHKDQRAIDRQVEIWRRRDGA